MILVVAPVVLSISTAAHLQRIELELLAFQHDARMARTGLALLEEEMQTSMRLLDGSAMELATPDTLHPGFLRAQAGEAVMALEPGEYGLDATLYIRDEQGAVRMARRSVSDPMFSMLEGRAGYEAVVYLKGKRVAATDPGLGPETLDRGVMAELAVLNAGVAVDLPNLRGALVPQRSAPGGSSGNVALLAMRTVPRRASLAGPFLLVAAGVALVLILLRIGTLSGYGSSQSGVQRPRVEFLVTSIPLILAMSAVVLVVFRFRADLASEGTSLLTRELAIAQALGPAAPVTDIQRITTFDATRLGGADDTQSTLGQGSAVAALAAQVAPSGPMVVTGRLQIPGRDLVYAAIEDGEGSVLILSEPEHEDHLRNFTARMGALAILLLLLLLIYPKGSTAVLRESELEA